ncbi:MAG: RNA polymerase sporulation sigma factor SigK [Ruminococcus sp.]|nr:RNA polymerase sporulation sigma factor SigK [Ruminococcus sp.]
MLELIISLLTEHFLFFALHFDNKTVFPKPLSAKEERECFERMANGDRSAKDKLIEHNLRLVAHIIKKYYSTAADQDDLISIGTFGLIKAVETFSPEKGSRFATYASRCIENEILMHFRSLRKSANDVHFDEPIETDRNGNKLTLIDIISDGGCIDEEVELNVSSHRLYELVESRLSEREREIIILRYGLYGHRPLTQRETASKLLISRSYVSRIEKAAIEKLREHFQ